MILPIIHSEIMVRRKWVNITVSEETRTKLHALKEEISEKIGVKMSVEDTINYLIKYYMEREGSR